jgi:sorting nexin-9/18/33
VLKGSAVEAAAPPSVHEKESSEGSDVDESDSNELARLGMGEADNHFVDTGPTWKSKLPPFKVLVHSPSKCTSTLSGAFTIYSLTSFFHTPSTHDSTTTDNEDDHEADHSLSSTRVTVHRRFSHFVMLHTALIRRLPGIALPPLPEKQYSGRFSNEFVEARRGDLERYINRVVRHPVARYTEILTFFLGCDNDIVSF